MLLLEIAAQGLKALALPGGALRLRPGYNVVAADGARLRGLVEALLYPGPQDGAALRAAGTTPGAARGGVTFVGDDGVTWRLVRDFAVGCQLHRFDPQKRAFALVGQAGLAEAAQLVAKANVPPRERFAYLCLAAGELPSRHVGGLGAGGAAVAIAAAAAPARRALTAAQAGRRMKELREELDRVQRAEKLQYRLDGLQSRMFKLEELLKEKARLEQELAEAEAALAQAGPAAGVAEKLGDVEAKLAAHARAVARRDDALARIQAEREALAAAEAQGVQAFWADPRFWAGAVAGAVAVAGAMVGGGQARYLALLDLPAFGWAAWVALGWVGATEDQGRRQRRLKLVDEHERKALEAFDRETVDVRGAMKALAVPTLAELVEALEAVAAARAGVAAVRARLEDLAARAETREAEAEKAKVEAELKEVDAALTGVAGGYLREPRSIEMELERLEAEPTVEDGPAAAPAAGEGPAGGEATAPAQAAPRDPLRELMAAAGRELGASPAGAVREVAARASQLLQGLCAGRLGGLGVDDRANLLVQVGGRPTPIAGVPPADRDLALVALKLAFLERAFAGGQRVAMVDEALNGLPEGVRRVAGRLLKQLAKPGQIVHATADLAFRESADHSA